MPRKMLVVAALVVLGVSLQTSLARAGGGYEDTERYYTVIDEASSKVILQTCHVVVVGDEFVDPENRRYRVVGVEGHTAWARFIGHVELEGAIAGFQDAWGRELAMAFRATPRQLAQAPAGRLVALYHTHSDESYIPTSGTHSVAPRGDVYNVGAVVTERLRRGIGLRAAHSWATHLPHDGAAYMRSRRTAATLLRDNPDALFDLHRDAAPLEAYATTVSGKPGAKVMIVLGRQNPNLRANEQFAFTVKSYADSHFPQFVRGIFYGDGTFNQDLSPRALLFEMGSHENSQEAAERVMVNFIMSIPAVLYGVTPQGPTARGDMARWAAREGSGAVSSIAWIAIIVLVGGAIFLLLNEGSLDAIRRRLRQLKNIEFASVLGVGRRRPPRRDGGTAGESNTGEANLHESQESRVAAPRDCREPD